jgi:hypothetical protein
MPTKNPRVTAVLPPNLFEIIEQMAKTEERSMSQMTAILIREALSKRDTSDRTTAKK